MKAKVLGTSVTFEFRGDNADDLVLGLSNELSEKELTVWSKNHSCSELRVLVEHDSRKVSDKIDWIK